MSKENKTFNKDALRKMNASTLKSLYELSQEILNEKILNGEIELGPDDFLKMHALCNISMVVVGNTPGIDFPRDYYKESYFYCNNHERKSSQFTTDLHTIFSGDFTILYEDK